MMHFRKLMPAAIGILALTSGAAVVAQDAHDHDAPAAPSQAATPASCPMGSPGMGPQAMHGAGDGPMQQQAMGDRQQMHQTMQQMRSEMQQMRAEMMALRQEMQRRRGN